MMLKLVNIEAICNVINKIQVVMNYIVIGLPTSMIG